MSLAQRHIGETVGYHGAPGIRCTVLEVQKHSTRISYEQLVPEGNCGYCEGDGHLRFNGRQTGLACKECLGIGWRPLHLEIRMRWVNPRELTSTPMAPRSITEHTKALLMGRDQ